MNKEHFLKYEFANYLAQIPPDTAPLFGKMNVHQMIEHMAYAFRQASGLIPLPTLGDEESTQKMYRFMMSDKPFKDNTPNPYLPETPEAPVCATIEASIEALQNDIKVFFDTFTDEPSKRIENPFFGNLNFDEWVHLLYKHAQHHLRQFGVQLN